MTYEQSQYMNGNQNANAPHPAPTSEPKLQGGNNLTYEQSKYNDEYQKRNNVAQEGLKTRQDQVLSKRQGDGSQDTKNGFADTMKKGWDTVKGWFNPQETSQSQTASYLPETMGDKEKSLYQNVASNDVDSDTKLQEQGQNMKKAIESVVPRYDKKTWKSLMTDPNMSWDQKAELVMNSLGGALSAGDTGQVRQTDKGTINDAITQQYAENIADRDKRAMNAAIEPLEALNKQKTDAELRLRDTVVGAYIDRYNAEQSAETKKKILEALIKDKGTWATLDDQQKIDTLAYIQALDGNGSLRAMALQEFGPDVLKWLKSIIKGNGEETETSNASTESITIDGVQVNTRPGAKVDQNDYNQNPDNYMVFPAYGGNSPVVLKKLTRGHFVVDNAGAKADREWVRQYLANNPSLTPEEKIAYAQEYEASMPPAFRFLEQQVKLDMEKSGEKNPSLQGIEVPVNEMKASQDAKALQARKDNATEVNGAVDRLKREVGKTKNNKQALEELRNLNEKALNMEDTGVIAKKYEDAINEYRKGAIREDMSSITKNKSMSAKEKLERLEGLVTENGDVLANDKDLKREVSVQKTNLEFDRDYREPYNEGVGNVAYSRGGSSKSPTKYVITDDGDLNVLSSGQKKTYKTSDFGFNLHNDNVYAELLNFIDENSKIDKVRQYSPDKSDKDIAVWYKGTPMYKFVEKLANNKILKGKVENNPALKDKYDSIMKSYSRWTNIR